MQIASTGERQSNSRFFCATGRVPFSTGLCTLDRGNVVITGRRLIKKCYGSWFYGNLPSLCLTCTELASMIGAISTSGFKGFQIKQAIGCCSRLEMSPHLIPYSVPILRMLRQIKPYQLPLSGNREVESAEESADRFGIRYFCEEKGLHLLDVLLGCDKLFIGRLVKLLTHGNGAC